MKIYIIILSVWISFAGFAQQYSESEKLSLLQKKGIEISASDVQKMNDYDFKLVINYNLDSYRNEKSDRQIQFVRGPIATIKSFDFCTLNQIAVDEKILLSKKNEIVSNKTHSLITQINIGLGYQQNELNPENY